jgi:predicted proteasome-type protease
MHLQCLAALVLGGQALGERSMLYQYYSLVYVPIRLIIF